MRTALTWLPWVALVALGAGVGVWEASRPAAIENPLANATFTHVTNWQGTEEQAEISPDGKFLAFASNRASKPGTWDTNLFTATWVPGAIQPIAATGTHTQP